MRTLITKTNIDWVDVKNACRNTVNKDDTDSIPNERFRLNLLFSEHSPIRLLTFRWKWYSMKSWVSVHFARHWLGWDKFISTQRSDRTGVNRDESPQGTLVTYDGQSNAQAVMNVSKVRLCFQASTETREAMEDLKLKVRDDVDKHIAYVCVPSCIYRGGCGEFPDENGVSGCGWYNQFVKRHPNVNMLDLRERYKAYNEEFYARVDSKNNQGGTTDVK
jgi:hypothetical protein